MAELVPVLYLAIRRSEFEPECLERDDHQLLKFSKFRGQSSEIRFKVNFYRINKYDLSFKIDFTEKVEIHAKSSGFFFTSSRFEAIRGYRGSNALRRIFVQNSRHSRHSRPRINTCDRTLSLV